MTDDVYLLAWIASARTAVPRNDGVAGVFLRVTCFSPSLRACEEIRAQEVMFIFELFRVIVFPIDIRCIIFYRVTIMKQISNECQSEMLCYLF